MRTRVKICCIASREEAAAAVAAGADVAGLVGAMPSGPGPIDEGTAADIAGALPPAVSSFLLTSETTADGIAAHVARVRPTAVQIVDHVDPAEVERLAGLAPGVRRVQVIHVEGEDALALAKAYARFVHAFLLDSGRPSLATKELGGTGRVHDWEVSRRFVAASERPVFLAGGLTADNVGRAIATVRPFGVDVCTGVRTNGDLDPERLGHFVKAVRAADAARNAGGS